MALGRELSAASLVKLVSFLFWAGLYLYSSVTWPNKSPEWWSRLVTLLHGIVATVVGLQQCGLQNLTPYRLGMKITTCHYMLMAWSWGYFAFDLLWCATNSETWLMLCHHVSALAGITIYMHKDYTGCTFACNLAMLEITNPLLQTRWFLRYEGYEKTLTYRIVEVLYLALFVIVRGALGTYLLYKILGSDMFDMDEKLISLVLYLVSMGLLYQMMGYVLYIYGSKIEAYLDDMGIILNQPY